MIGGDGTYDRYGGHGRPLWKVLRHKECGNMGRECLTQRHGKPRGLQKVWETILHLWPYSLLVTCPGALHQLPTFFTSNILYLWLPSEVFSWNTKATLITKLEVYVFWEEPKTVTDKETWKPNPMVLRGSVICFLRAPWHQTKAKTVPEIISFLYCFFTRFSWKHILSESPALKSSW